MNMKRGNFLTNRTWFRYLIEDSDLILCHTSALECLGLFCGYFNEYPVDVYAKAKGETNNINYRIVDTFVGIETVQIDCLLCTSVNQTFNDMLSLYGTPYESTVDEQALVEGLSNYYFSNGESFEGLMIKLESRERFDILKVWAMEYYSDN